MDKLNLKTGKNKVTYNSDGVRISALVFVPEDYKAGEKRPALIVIRPASGVKEQTAGLYAKALSDKGFITLAFDPKGYGESQGRPQVEDPYSIISDAKNSISFLESLDQVDANNIFSVGICMGSGYATSTGAEDKRVKGVATISPIISNFIDTPKAYGGKFVFQSFLFVLKPIVNLFGMFGINFYTPLAPISWFERNVIPMMDSQWAALQYYGKGKPGDVPNWKNKINYYKSENATLKYNPFEWIPKLKHKPFLMAYAEGGQNIPKIKEFYEQVDVENKDLMYFEGATHFDLYYKPEFVNPIVDRINDTFRQNIQSNNLASNTTFG